MLRRTLLVFLIVFLSAPAGADEIGDADSALMRGDYASAVQIFEELSSAGNATAMVRLANLYHRGEGIVRDMDKAVALYLSAAELGHAEAQFNLGNMYLLGEGLPQDEDWALTFYRLAAKQGHQLAGQNMRELYRANGIAPPALEGDGVGQGAASATAPNELAAVSPVVAEETAAVESEQITAVDAVPDDGGPTEREAPREAAATVQQPIADATATKPPADEAAPAPSPVPDDEMSEEAPEDQPPSLASEISDAAVEVAEQEVDPAPIITLEAIETPVERTIGAVSADEEGAIRLAREHGIEVELDGGLSRAPSGAQPSAPPVREAGAPADYSARLESAKRTLALENFDHAIGKLTRLAEDGVGEAALLLADMAERGAGMPTDPELAMKWRREAADLGNAAAQYEIAERYMHGRGVDPDDAMAITFYRDAARGGHPSAKEKLGVIYADAGLPIPDVTRPREPIAIYSVAPTVGESEGAAVDSGLQAKRDGPVGAGADEMESADAVALDRSTREPEKESASVDLLQPATRLSRPDGEIERPIVATVDPGVIVTHPPAHAPLPSVSPVLMEPVKPENHEVIPGSTLVVRGPPPADQSRTEVAVAAASTPKDSPMALDEAELAAEPVFEETIATDVGVEPIVSAAVEPVAANDPEHVVSPGITVTHPPAYVPLVFDSPVVMEPAKPVNHEVVPGSVLAVTRRPAQTSVEKPKIEVAIAASSDEVDTPTALSEAELAAEPLTEINVAELVEPEHVVAFDDADPAIPAATDRPQPTQTVVENAEPEVVAPVVGAATSSVAAAPNRKGFLGRLKSFFSGDAERPETSADEHGAKVVTASGGAGAAMTGGSPNTLEDTQSSFASTGSAYATDRESTDAAQTHETAAVDSPFSADALSDPTDAESEAIVAAVDVEVKSERDVTAQTVETIATIEEAKRALADGRFAAAAEIFRRLAEGGNAEAQAHLGYMYYKGEGVDVDLADAVDWYRRAAVQGNRDAQYNLAVAYAFGEGVAQDDAEAVTWYRRAAEQGSAIAQYSLGVSYALGEGVSQDNAEAAKWYRAAAEQGYAAAQYNLGYCYRAGQGVEADDSLALQWFAAAARNGHASAQYSLGYMYRSGRGAARNLDEAIRWYRLAAAQGHPDARADLASLNTDDL